MRFINADDYELISTLASTIGQLNLYAYCNDNPIMNTDPTGTWWSAETWLKIASYAAIIGGIVLTATGLGGIAGGILLAAGAGSLIGGYVNEARGGSFTAGWVGGAIAGFLCGTGSGVGGLLLLKATNAVNLACLGLAASGLFCGFLGGATGSYAGSFITAQIDRKKFNKKEALYNAATLGCLNMLATLGSCSSIAASKAGETGAYKFLAVYSASLTEAFYDASSYGIGKIFDYYNKNSQVTNLYII